MPITFDTLNPVAQIFQELNKNPNWWKTFKECPSLYIEVRKDNQVNVYYEGGSIARIHYRDKKLQVFTHHKYLGHPAPSKKSPYIECSEFVEESWLDDVLDRIKTHYSQKNNINGTVPKEKWSEKFIQGSLITQSRQSYLDSEFAYNDEESKNRIDLVKCAEGIVTFVELKRMDDNRMLHETDATPEVVFQINRYKQFIEKYSSELLGYYQKLYDIKKSLQLPVPDVRPMSINLDPELLIFDRWEKYTKRRDIHRNRLVDILQKEHVKFNIISDF